MPLFKIPSADELVVDKSGSLSDVASPESIEELIGSYSFNNADEDEEESPFDGEPDEEEEEDDDSPPRQDPYFDGRFGHREGYGD